MAQPSSVGTPWAVETGDNYQHTSLVADPVTGNIIALAADASSSQKSSTKQGETFTASEHASWGARIAQLPGAAAFLPVGFPDSVRPEYLEYQAWDTVQALSSYLRGIFTTRALLAAVGVGNSDASALAAAITWVLRDGAGMLGALIFGFVAGGSFDCHLKEWRLFADVINDLGLTLDLLAPSLPSRWLMPILCLATLCKAACGVAAGSTKAAITAHLARQGNTADVQAKEGAQETLVTLGGMLIGVALATQLERWERAEREGSSETDDESTFLANQQQLEQEQHQELVQNVCWSSFFGLQSMVWGCFGVLTLVHVYANWKGVVALRLRVLNRHRVELCLKAYRRTSTTEATAVSPPPPPAAAAAATPLHVAGLAAAVTPDACATAESSLTEWLHLPKRIRNQSRIALGQPLQELTFNDFYTRADIDAVRACLANSPSFSTTTRLQSPPRRYLLTFQRRSFAHKWSLFYSSATSVVRASLESGASPLDELRCFHHARALIQYLENHPTGSTSSSSSNTSQGNAKVAHTSNSSSSSISSSSGCTNAGATLVEAVTAARILADAEWPHFLKALQASPLQSPLPLPPSQLSHFPAQGTIAGTSLVEDSGWDLSRVALGSGSWRYQFTGTTGFNHKED